MLRRTWLLPPLAFARVGTSPVPCAAFMWGPNDTSPRGTGTTTLVPVETLQVAPDGTVTSSMPHEVLLRDEHGIRPVCPFFEVHGEWTEAGEVKQGPLTESLLGSWGATLADVQWQVQLGSLKAFHYTFEEGDRIEAVTTVTASDTTRRALHGVSPPGAAAPLVLPGKAVHMGDIQAVKPTSAFPELRLRVYAPRGLVYGPSDLPQRLAAADFTRDANVEWDGFRLPAEQLIVNPNSGWARYVPAVATLGPLGGDDYRNTPGGLLATLEEPIDFLPETPVLGRSLGLVDDVGDGFVACTVAVGGQAFRAVARIVVGPPDFAPASRPPVSLADNLADRDDRSTPRTRTWTRTELTELVADILERAFETASLVHKDYQNFRSRRTNDQTLINRGPSSPFDAEDVSSFLWPAPDAQAIQDGRMGGMPLSAVGDRKHRRMMAIEYLEDRFRESPDLFEQWIRRPVSPSPYFDKRMPALMRGSDGQPLHLTRRQWEILRAWIDALRAEATVAGAPGPGRHA